MLVNTSQRWRELSKGISKDLKGRNLSLNHTIEDDASDSGRCENIAFQFGNLLLAAGVLSASLEKSEPANAHAIKQQNYSVKLSVLC